MSRGRQYAIGVTVLLLSLLSWIAGPAPARAQTMLSGGVIQEIRVEGAQRVEPETVRSYMRVNPGDPFDPIRLDRSLKNLFATGLFADVTLRREGDALVVSVVENPIINRIAFEGNDRITDETLQAEVTLRPRVVFTRTKAQQDAQRLLEIYRRSGRYAATVEPKVIQLPQNRVDLVFEIEEGPLTKIEAINFIGNRAFSDSSLRDRITTSETAFWNIFSSTDTYDPDRLTFDRELLRRFYLSEGYADFRVVSVVAELLPSREGFIVTFTVEEGERQKFGAIGITTTLRDLDPETLRSQLTTSEGDWYDAEAIERSISNLTDAVGDRGYAFVDIRTRTRRDREKRIIEVTYEINEGPKVYVERIDIEGNVRTLDRVVRREFNLVEGDAFNAAKLRRSRRNIQNLGFFRTVEIENEPGSTEDRTVVKVSVEEQSTGDFTFGAGFSTAVGPLGTVGIRERNLLGRGQDLRLNLTLSGEQSQIDLGFTEPYFLGRNLAAGFDVFRTENKQKQRSFDLKRTGGSLRTGFDWQQDLRQILRYTIEQRQTENLDSDASLLVREEEGSLIKSTVSQELVYDVRDSRLDPREGWVARLRNEVSGLGGDVRILKTTAGGAYYLPITDNFTASLRGEVGNVFGLGQDTRISDRFVLGGNNFRGFEFAGVGPRDAASDDPLGGKYFYTGTAELSFPLGLPDEIKVRGRVFTDFGSTWDLDKPSNLAVNIQDVNTPRISAGAGLSWESPFGPIIVDLGYAVLKQDFDNTQLFNFSFGTQF